MRNSDRFLASFNSIEIALRKYAEDDHYVPFSRLIQKAYSEDAVVNRYYNDLKEFSELRNAIVHNTIDVNAAIAEPHDFVVERIEFIEKEIKEPKKVIPLFSKSVVKFKSSDSLIDILLTINQHDFSKFPVYENESFIGLLTKKEIVDWMAKNIKDLNTIVFDKVYLKDVLFVLEDKNLETNHKRKRKNKKKKSNHLFISRNATIYDVKEIFRRGVDTNGPRIEAILITEHGKTNESLLGIITPWDLIDLDDNV